MCDSEEAEIEQLRRRHKLTGEVFMMPKVWRIKGELRTVDLAASFFCFKFSNSGDYEMALSGGPWFMRGQALLLKPWRPNFQRLLERTDTIPIWIQFPGLPVEYLHEIILRKLAESVGQFIKIDEVTMRRQRAKYARICILWDLTRTVPNGIWVKSSRGKFWQAVAVENIPKLCYHCGKIRHTRNQCVAQEGMLMPDKTTDSIKDCRENNEDAMTGSAEEKGENIYGPWQIVSRKRRGGFRREKRQENGIRNSFGALKEEEKQKMKSDNDGVA
ncbi:hypothetical protein Cni_G18239 [Canna indica]|uniref:DUF4283 domain-containing protein n=1 Tax=Canna indica TaxID=4628 RepID=A0AAQ3QE68_9LILI|nr:hypothetical protein Cni_G18239 [Canna indica]